MLIDINVVAIYVRPGVTDMRKAINGLSVIAAEQMEKDPLSGSLFLFCNRHRRNLKCLYWDRNGFCLWQKRLERDKFPWPQSEEAARQISAEQLRMLLDEAHPSLVELRVPGLAQADLAELIPGLVRTRAERDAVRQRNAHEVSSSWLSRSESASRTRTIGRMSTPVSSRISSICLRR